MRKSMRFYLHNPNSDSRTCMLGNQILVDGLDLQSYNQINFIQFNGNGFKSGGTNSVAAFPLNSAFSE